MVVWIVNPYDNLPLEGYRPQRYWLMARAFARHGHDVTLWSSDFSHAHKSKREMTGERLGTLAEAELWNGDGFRLALISAPPYGKNICLKRVLSHAVLARRWRSCAERTQTPDLIVASSPPLSLCAAVRRFAVKRGIPFIVDVMDAWPETFARVLPSPILAPLASIARRNYCGATGVSVVARRYAELVRGYGVTCDVHVCPHGVELHNREKTQMTQSRSNETLRLVYCGNMGASYDLATLIDVVRAHDPFELDLAGAGPKEAELRARASECPRIRFHGYLDDDALRSLLVAADAGVVPMFPDSCVGIPYKLADYAAAGLPIVNSLPGESAQLIADCGAGFTYNAGSVESLSSALDSLAAADCAALRAGADALAKIFDADAIYPEYVSWAEGICVA